MLENKQTGFTLIETLIAFSILTICLLIIFQIFSNISYGLRKSQDFVIATTLVKSKLHERSIEQETEGVFQERFHWQLSRRHIDPSEIFDDAVFSNTYKLYEYDVVVTWKQNRKPISVEASVLGVER